MVEDLVIHIGDCKAGSTSIQTALAEGACRVPENAIAFPAALSHRTLVVALQRGLLHPDSDTRFRMVRKHLRNSKARIGVISAEDFEFLPPEVLRDAIARYLPDQKGRVRLIAYVRPHGERLVSSFAERTKVGGGQPTLEALHEKFAETGFLKYAPRLLQWRQVFGEALTVRPLIRPLLRDGDVVADFHAFLFGDTPFELAEVPPANPSACIEDLVTIREIQRTIRQNYTDLGPAHRALGWSLLPMLSKRRTGGGTRLNMDRALAERVVATYREDAAEVDAAFFEGTPLSDSLVTTLDKACEAPLSLEVEHYFDTGAIDNMRAYADLLGRMMSSDEAAFVRNSRNPTIRDRARSLLHSLRQSADG